MDQFWFPNGAERQNCTVSAPFLHHLALSPWCDFCRHPAKPRALAQAGTPAVENLTENFTDPHHRLDWRGFGEAPGLFGKETVKFRSSPPTDE